MMGGEERHLKKCSLSGNCPCEEEDCMFWKSCGCLWVRWLEAQI